MVGDALVAIGTLALAAVTLVLVLITRSSVSAASKQIEFERKRADAAQWPRAFPAPSSEWTASRGNYAGLGSSHVLPVKNGGTGVALNVSGELDFTGQGGRMVRFVTTSIAPGDGVDLQIEWPRAPAPAPSAPGHPAVYHADAEVEKNWTKVGGHLTYQDIAKGHSLTRFTIETEGGRGYRRVWVHETELVQRGDGKTLVPPESFEPEAWYTPVGREQRRVRRTRKPG